MTGTITPTTTLPTPMQGATGPGAQRSPAATGAPGSPPALVLDPGALADPVERERALGQLLRYRSQVAQGPGVAP
jgi:hypothetical protein